jgi:hypothetical protein
MENPLALGTAARTPKAAGVAVALAVALAACGDSNSAKSTPAVNDDQRGILATVDALQTASRRNDAARICNELFTSALAKSIQSASKHSCEAEVRDTLTSPDAELSVSRKIDIKGSHATARIREQDGTTSAVSFVKDGGRWRIERVAPVKQP